MRKETLGSTYNHLQVCGHWYSAVASTESTVCIRNGKNGCRLMRRNGRKSWLVTPRSGVLSWQTLDLRHDAADQCPDMKPWVESIHCVEMIAHLEPRRLMERGQETLQKLLIQRGRFKTTRGCCLYSQGYR